MAAGSGGDDGRLPPGVRRKGNGYEIYFRVGGQNYYESKGLTTLRQATRRLGMRKRAIREGRFSPEHGGRRLTVEQYLTEWNKAREGHVATWKDDRSRLRHVIRLVGTMHLDEIDAPALLKLFAGLRTTTSARGELLAKKSVFSIAALFKTALADAEQRDLIERNPFRSLRRGQMPKKPRRWETQRGAFPEAAVEALISDSQVPHNRQTFYALLLLTGMRFSEAAGLRWEDYDPTWEPLGRIHLRRQWHDRSRSYESLKGKAGEPGPPREIPVHPTLAAILAEWRLSGWPKFFGRSPKPTDIIVPSVNGPEFHRTLRNGLHRLKQDCDLLKVRPLGGSKPTVTQHECRNTFVTLAQAGGAPEAWVRRITHNASGDVLAGYTVNDWSAMCEAVMAIKIERRRGGDVIRLPLASGSPDDDAGYGFLMASTGTEPKSPRIAGASGRDGRDSNPRPPA